MNAAPAWTVRWFDSARDIPKPLWAGCFPPPLEGLWWYLALEDSGLEDQFHFGYALLEKNGEAAGIAPTFVFNVPMDLVAPPWIAKGLHVIGKLIPRVLYQRTLFVGSPCSDEGTIGLIEPQDMPAALIALRPALRDRAKSLGAPMLVYKDFTADAEAAFIPFLASNELFRVVSYPGTRVDLHGPDFAAFLKTLSGSHRHTLKKKLKRSREMGTLETQIIREPDEPMREQIFALFWQTYLKGKTKFEILNRTFFKMIAADERSNFILISDPATGKLVAFMLCFRIGPRVINKFIGIDYTYGGNWYLYFRLLEAAIDWASRAGANDFQSGQTGYRAKTDSGHALVPLTNYCSHRVPLLHFVFAKVAKGIDWAGLDSDLKTWVAAHPDSIEKA